MGNGSQLTSVILGVDNLGQLKTKPYNKIHIEISNICNLQCSFCPKVERQAGRMTLATFERAIGQVAPYTSMVCLHLMGEPLGHPDLAKIVELCQAHNLKIFFVTNGLLLRSQQKQLLLDPVFFQINFSLHSFHDNFGSRDPSVYLQHIFDFTERAFKVRPDLYINYRLWNLTEANGHNLNNQEMLEQIASRFDPTLVERCSNRSQRSNGGRLLKSLPVRNRLYIHFDSEFTWPDLSLPVLSKSGSCYGLKSHFGILVDGTVVPCCLDKEGVIALGNIMEEDLHNILRSQRAQQVRQGFSQGQLIEALCQRCQYAERFRSRGQVIGSSQP